MSHLILRLPDVIRVTGLGRSTIYQRIADGSFPKPISLGGRAVGWIADEIDIWINERIAASRADCSQPNSIEGAGHGG